MSPDDNTTAQSNLTPTGRLGFHGRHASPEGGGTADGAGPRDRLSHHPGLVAIGRGAAGLAEILADELERPVTAEVVCVLVDAAHSEPE